jgi:thymidylate synthase (FAD)
MEVVVTDASESPEETICRAARNDYMAAYGANKPFAEVMESIDGETIREKKETLIARLLDHGHYGPFEHPQITFHVKDVSRSLMAQLTRHRNATYDVQSMRYVNLTGITPEPGEGFVVIPELGNAELHGRNAEIAEDIRAEMSDEEIAFERENVYREALEQSVSAYERLLRLGTAPENARMVLPIGTTVNIVFSLNARSLMHVADMRAAADAQWEIREMTEAVLDKAEAWCPITFDHYREELQDRKNRLAP